MTAARVAAIACLFLAVGAAGQSMAIERAKYAVVLTDSPYEIRDYTDSIVAIVVVQGARSDTVSSGFRLLADYIFGNNQDRTKIAMTAPVTQIPKPAQAAQNSWIIRFVMPAAYTLQTLPPPSDARVRFEKSAAHRVAAIRFSGFWTDANMKSHEAQLFGWIQKQHLVPRSAPVYAYYDPPWTPWFMRTIEVLVDI